ncbi:hypothetical protein ACQUFR_00805 [Acinetobacter johnsonii]|uniref:hypothetical protein n=1 Tax=Acinetobacter johnsonii TaxID=40214 RepID=UPI003D1758AC
MSSKYDLDKLLDPYGINKFQKTITRITDPFKEYLAVNPSMASITGIYESPALEAMKKASMPFKEYLAANPSMASIAGVYESPALEAMKKASMPFKEYLAANPSMASIAGVYESPALEAMKKASMPFKEYLAVNPSMASIAGVYESPALEAMKKASMPFKEYLAANPSMASIAGVYEHPALEAMKKASMPFKEYLAANPMASIAGAYESPALEAIKSAASYIAINTSLGLQADVQRLIAAKTLIPGLNTKIFNLNQKLYAIAGLTEQSPNQNNFDSIQNYLETLEEFNEKYHQDINIDRTAIQTLDLVLQQQETLELTSDLRDIGIFDTSSGSILLEYLETLPKNKASFLSRLIVCLLVWFAETVTEPIINEYEPIKNNQKSLVNFLNDVEGLARVIKDCDLKDQPNGLKEMSLEKESIVTLYKTNEDIPDGWSKIKFNKDGHDITGYIKTSELHLLD